MQMNNFATSGILRNYTYSVEPIAAKLPSGPFQPRPFGGLSTAGLLPPPQPARLIHEKASSVGVEEYRNNSAALRQQAIVLAAGLSINIDLNEDGSRRMGAFNPSDSSAVALEKMRATGGEKQIAWSRVDMQLQIHGKGVGQASPDEAALEIDYFASEYVQYRTRIEKQLTGSERTSELVKLDDLFSKRVGEAASGFADTVGNFLETNGVPGEQSALKNSFMDIYEQRKQTYLTFIEANPDYARVEGSEDEWLLNAGDFMGEQLRYALHSQQSEMSLDSEFGYSVDELHAVGTMAKEFTKLQRNLSSSIGRSEEELGFNLGLAAMKYEMISGHFEISDRIKDKMDKAFNGLIRNQIEQVETYMEQQKRDPFVRNKEAYALDFDRQAVLSIVRQMVENLRSDDINTAFKEDFNTYASLYQQKMNDAQLGSQARYNAYYSAWVNQNPAGDWNRFVQQLCSSNHSDLNRYLLQEPASQFNMTV